MSLSFDGVIIDKLTCERDAALLLLQAREAECVELRLTLRKYAILTCLPEDKYCLNHVCKVCRRAWPKAGPERHGPGCPCETFVQAIAP